MEAYLKQCGKQVTKKNLSDYAYKAKKKNQLDDQGNIVFNLPNHQGKLKRGQF